MQLRDMRAVYGITGSSKSQFLDGMLDGKTSRYAQSSMGKSLIYMVPVGGVFYALNRGIVLYISQYIRIV